MEEELSKLDDFREVKRKMEDTIVQLEAAGRAAEDAFRADQADQVRAGPSAAFLLGKATCNFFRRASSSTPVEGVKCRQA